ncbi:ABC transporter substrate binding protein (PQQ-dependent alcohol dehydrogenase system) [Rhodopseudomonas julia]|uniref:ABC transporter substrate binding protein (PQQ-dependent alcohol dehydrogenase system) n=1 Tax=Rhodopseudomonas julia TaxID=200617 RepID=A0ABU0CAQ6_9BRAD|nr:ABC transporter substrate-binding protein [Rhodopseudomonas julia]MDQ0327601.1 ABC transporter substrate binding protein (PQQ-dependent alcohol dehydrogenase system) [Rhodopseudomonas julia]
MANGCFIRIDILRNLLATLSLVAFTLAFGDITPVAAEDAAGAENADSEVTIGYLRSPLPDWLPISLSERPREDDGIAGARLAITDNNTTGRFTGQKYELEDAAVSDQQQALDALGEMNAEGVRFVVADLPADTLLAITDEAAKTDTLVFNIGAADDRLREADCRGNLIHVTPSRAMLADALVQYLVTKKWTRLFLLVGSHAADEDYAAAVERAAKRFGAKIVEKRVFTDTGGARTTDSGLVQVDAQMAVFTQSAPDHDVVVVADESEIFGPYVPYHTWDPRPVAGTSGLKPTSWSAAHDQWAGIQIQNRFVAAYDRQMTAKDMDAWTAVRMIGEAATRSSSTDAATMANFIKGPSFEVAAFKGQKLTLRDWNWQLRQPILLADGRMVVSVSPQEGFLHQTSTLDTLGYDRPESGCRL